MRERLTIELSVALPNTSFIESATSSKWSVSGSAPILASPHGGETGQQFAKFQFKSLWANLPVRTLVSLQMKYTTICAASK
jgi:hypothetical protein